MTAEHSHAPGNGQGHSHTGGSHTGGSQKALAIAFALTAGFAIVEFVGGFAFNSLALRADAVHMFSDVFALFVALVAGVLSQRPASRSHSFGWRRSEVLAAQINGLLLIAVSVWIVDVGVQRVGEPTDVHGGGLLVVGAVGLLVNLVATVVLRRGGDNVNTRAAALHTISDAAGSVGAVVAGIAAVVWQAHWVDPAVSIFIAALVIIAAFRLLNETTHVLLEGSPKRIDVQGLEDALTADAAVDAVHHVHVWSLTSSELAMSAHVELLDTENLHEAQAHGARLKEMLAEKFGVGHATLELECHRCEVSEHVP